MAYWIVASIFGFEALKGFSDRPMVGPQQVVVVVLVCSVLCSIVVKCPAGHLTAVVAAVAVAQVAHVVAVVERDQTVRVLDKTRFGSIDLMGFERTASVPCRLSPNCHLGER